MSREGTGAAINANGATLEVADSTFESNLVRLLLVCLIYSFVTLSRINPVFN